MENKDCYITHNCKKYQSGNCPTDDNFCMRLYKIDYLFNNSLLSDNQRQPNVLRLDKDKCDKVSYDLLNNKKNDIINFANRGENLYIYSSTPGNGKTSWAINLLQEYIFKVWPEASLECKVLFINVPKFLIELKLDISRKSEYIAFIKENVSKADIVVWDDVGTKSASEFEHEHLLSLIDSRMFENKANIFTSNIQPNELTNLLGGRLASRIINNSQRIEFIGKDKRGLK